MFTFGLQYIKYLTTLLLVSNLYGQATGVLDYVNPFIGTAKSSSYTKWGNEGGTYAGAVAPSGYIQLSPETSLPHTRGYDYADSSIYNFSCFQHHSGYPNGSKGRIHIMPVNSVDDYKSATYCRTFSHADESAKPGFYSILFRDNNTLVEITATTRVGKFRFTFPAGIAPKLKLTDLKSISFSDTKTVQDSIMNVVIKCSKPITNKEIIEGGYVICFDYSTNATTVIELTISVSNISTTSAQRNIDVEGNISFDEMKRKTMESWRNHLSVVEVEDADENNKHIFYTALYHSLLIPWVISDVDGKYRGADSQIHTTKGNAEYGLFSPWDTYRTLHPLLSLLYPEKQKDALFSLMNIYNQKGHLPTEPMTGNHAIAIITDAYLKGIRNLDSLEIYYAMKKGMSSKPYIHKDLEEYNNIGFIPYTCSESVTKTVEYAYNYWALAQYAKEVMKNTKESAEFSEKGNYYRNLFSPESRFLLPRKGNNFKQEPNGSGYKEGDKWVYSYAIPHNTQDIVNLMGGKTEFISRLENALQNNKIVFDNETVFNVPYLFGVAGEQKFTQKWINNIIKTRFLNTPGGLPGNDDLGSLSSWYVFSALGIYPFCVGKPIYSLVSPLFTKTTLHLPNNIPLIIQKEANLLTDTEKFQSVFLNNIELNSSYISHSDIVKGGEITFKNVDNYSKIIKDDYILSETKETPKFKINNYKVSNKSVYPGQSFYLKFEIKNNGSLATKVIKIKALGKIVATKNILVSSNTSVLDSIKIKLFAEGKTAIFIDDKNVDTVNVIRPKQPYPNQPLIEDIKFLPVVKLGDSLRITCSLKNIGGTSGGFIVPIRINNVSVSKDSIYLSAGEKKQLNKVFKVERRGMNNIQIGSETLPFCIYHSKKEALILDVKLSGKNTKNNKLIDFSGFNNHGFIVGNNKKAEVDSLYLDNNCFVGFNNSHSLDSLGKCLTLMAWVYPSKSNHKTVSILTKGDEHVLHADAKNLSFFAGGWGRGECSTPLPDNWTNNWHHVAGVCDGKSLNIYIDGQLKGVSQLDTFVNLSNNNRWNIGRNEEFTDQRIFTGYIDKVQVFASALSTEDIVEIIKPK